MRKVALKKRVLSWGLKELWELARQVGKKERACCVNSENTWFVQATSRSQEWIEKTHRTHVSSIMKNFWRIYVSILHKHPSSAPWIHFFFPGKNNWDKWLVWASPFHTSYGYTILDPVTYSTGVSSYLHNSTISSNMTNVVTADEPGALIFFSKDFLLLVRCWIDICYESDVHTYPLLF